MASKTVYVAGVARLAICGLLLLVAGCEERGISERNVPEGVEVIADESAAPEPGSGGTDDAGGGDGTVTPPWSPPANWRRVEEDAPMRLATFVAELPGGEAEVLVSRFPGDVGGELANVNRWRRQMGLDPIDATGLAEEVTRFGRPGRQGYRVRIRGADSTLIAAGWHEAEHDRTWFVKSVVSTSAVADRLAQEIVTFAKSIGESAPPRTDTE